MYSGTQDRGKHIYCMMDGTPEDSITIKKDLRGTAPDKKKINKRPICQHSRTQAASRESTRRV